MDQVVMAGLPCLDCDQPVVVFYMQDKVFPPADCDFGLSAGDIDWITCEDCTDKWHDEHPDERRSE